MAPQIIGKLTVYSTIFRSRTKKISKYHISGLLWGETTGDSPHKGPVMQKVFPCHDIKTYFHCRYFIENMLGNLGVRNALRFSGKSSLYLETPVGTYGRSLLYECIFLWSISLCTVSMMRMRRNHFMYAPSQWEMMLHCNVISHWLGAYTKWSLMHIILLCLEAAIVIKCKDIAQCWDYLLLIVFVSRACCVVATVEFIILVLCQVTTRYSKIEYP